MTKFTLLTGNYKTQSNFHHSRGSSLQQQSANSNYQKSKNQNNAAQYNDQSFYQKAIINHKRKHSIEAEKLNLLNNVEEFQARPYQRLINDQELKQYKEFQPTRAQSALDFSSEQQIRHRRVQSHAFQDRSPVKFADRTDGDGGMNSPSKKSSVNPEVKFLSQLDTVKQNLKEHTKVVVTNEQVEHEIQLLKKVRQMTQKSYHNRIRTGDKNKINSRPISVNQYQYNVKPKKQLQSNQRKLIDVRNLKFNSSQDEQDFKLDELKSLIYSLPVILAKNPQDKDSSDYLFFKGTNFLYNHNYTEAIDVFSQAEIQNRTITQFQREMSEFNKAYSLYKMDRVVESVRIFENISFYQLQILSKFNLAIINCLEQKYLQAFEHIDYCLQQVILGFMKIDWLSIDKFNKRCIKVYKEISRQLRLLLKKEAVSETNEKFKKKLDSYDDYFFLQFQKQKDPKSSNPDTLRTQAQLRTASVTNIAQSRSSSSLAPTINLNKQRSISMTSEYDLFTSTNNSPKTRMNKPQFKEFQIKPQQNNLEEQKEYFPMPFEVSKRMMTSDSQNVRNQMKIKNEREKEKNQKLLNKLIRPQSNFDSKKRVNQSSFAGGQEDLNQNFQEVSFMSQENMEKLVFKQYDNIKIYSTQDGQQQASQPSQSKFKNNLMKNFNKQRTQFSLQDKDPKSSTHHQQSVISMDVLDEEIKAYQDDHINFDKYDKNQQSKVSISSSQIETDELGLPRVKPLYLDKENDVTMDRILGLKPGEEMNEKERDVVEKINKFEKDYMIEKVLENMQNQEQEEDYVPDDSIAQRNQEFFMDNFFKIYDRTPNTKATQSPTSSKKIDIKNKFKQQLTLKEPQKQQLQNSTDIAENKDQHKSKTQQISAATNKNNSYYTHYQQLQQKQQNSSFRNNTQNNNSTNQSQRGVQQRQSFTLKSTTQSNKNQTMSKYEDSSSSESEGDPSKPKDTTYKNRLRLSEVEEIQQFILDRDENQNYKYSRQIDQYLKRLSFFAKYPFSIRQQLMSECQLRKIESGERLFMQGDSSKEFYVILRGSTKAILIKKDYGNIPIVINTFYDGKEFGEVNLYEESETLNAEMVKQLNKQKYTCETMEDSYIISLEKEKTNKIINANLQANFEKRIEFLKQIDIFKGLEMHVLLPLANNLITEHYRLGEYILKEGQQPKGLYLLYNGQCKVGSEKLNMRSKNPFQFGNKLKKQVRNFKFKGNFHDLQHEINFDGMNNDNIGKDRVDTRESGILEPLHIAKPAGEGSKRLRSEKRVFQNDRIYFDENGKRIKEHIVYKDYMVFFTLTMKDYFGGKQLLVGDNTNQKNYYFDTKEGDLIEDEIALEKNQSITFKDDQNSSLSVVRTNLFMLYNNLQIADSSEVELLIMDRTQLSYFQEKIQKEIYHRIEKAFQPDQPYEGTVVEKIKDKFREWEKYKLETVNSILKQSYAEKKKAQILNLNR
eukprot:403330805